MSNAVEDMIAYVKRVLRRFEEILQAQASYKFFLKDWILLSDLKACAQLVQTMRFTRNLKTIELAGPRSDKWMIIAPHPDDEIIGCGGTIISGLRAGKTVKVVFLTNGGNNGESAGEAPLVARKVGFDCQFLNFDPGKIPLDHEIMERLQSIIAEFGASALFLPFVFDDNDDHRRASELLAKMHASGRLPAYIEIWAYQVYTSLLPNVAVDITDVLEDKLAVLRMYNSQFRNRDWAHYVAGLNAYNSRLVPTEGEKKYFEIFHVVGAKEYAEFCGPYFNEPGKAYYSEYYCSENEGIGDN